MNCLLCDQELPNHWQFLELLQFKQPKPTACPSCLANFEKIIDGCQQCGGKTNHEASCRDCQYWAKKGVQIAHRALFYYTPAMHDYFSTYKFKGDYKQCQVFSAELRSLLKPYRKMTIVPIPISTKRYAKRGFNQVEAMLDAGKLPYQRLLIKSNHTISQSSQTRKARLQLSQPFSINPEIKLNLSQKIVLIDDVYTTGATIFQATQCLQVAGFTKIQSISLAR